MKNFFLSATFVLMTMYSCSSEMDEEIKDPSYGNLELKKHNYGSSKLADTLISPNGLKKDSVNRIDPLEINYYENQMAEMGPPIVTVPPR